MKFRSHSIVLSAACFALAGAVHAYPPAPFYTIYGTVRNDVGDVVTSSNSTVVVRRGTEEIARGAISSAVMADQNYQIQLRLDHVRDGTRLYADNAVPSEGNFTLAVELNGVEFLPIEIQGQLTAGKGGERVRIDLTIGEDSDQDGLPDHWEEWQLYLAGVPPLANGRWDISLITRDGDYDGDGKSNYLEYIAGTYAGDGKSFFQLEIKGTGPTATHLEFYEISGRTYQLESSSDSAVWTPQPMALTVGGEPLPFHRATTSGVRPIFASPAAGKMFYRLTVQ